MTKTHDNKLDRFFWCTMPFNEECLSKIPYSHQIRPYYFFEMDEDKGIYYSFPCTHNLPRTHDPESSFLRYRTTTIRLNACTIINDNSVLDGNECNKLGILDISAYDKLIKRLKVNYNYPRYPTIVKERIEEEMQCVEYNLNDILFHRTKNKYILASQSNGGYKCYRFSYLPVEGYAEEQVDGHKCYIDINNPFTVSNLKNYSLSGITSSFSRLKQCKQIDYASKTIYSEDLYGLPIGSLLKVNDGEKEFYYLKVSQSDKEITYLVKEKGDMHSNSCYCSIPVSHKFDYTFCGISTDSKMKYVLSKK